MTSRSDTSSPNSFDAAHRAIQEREAADWYASMVRARTDGALLRKLTLSTKSERKRLLVEYQELRKATWHKRDHKRMQSIRSRRAKLAYRAQQLAQIARFYRANSGE